MSRVTRQRENGGIPGLVHTTPEKFENEGYTLKTHQMYSLLRTVSEELEEFEKGGYTMETHQMFSVHTTSEEFKNGTITGHLDLCLEKNRSGKSRDYRT